MKHSSLIALMAAGLGLATLGGIATTAVRAASSDETPAVATTVTTASPPMRLHNDQRLTDMAKLFGMSTTELQTALQSGKEFYQIAAEHGVTYDTVQANAETTYKAKLDDMVKVGYVTQAEADAFLKHWQTRAAEDPMIGFGLGGPRGGMMGR